VFITDFETVIAGLSAVPYLLYVFYSNYRTDLHTNVFKIVSFLRMFTLSRIMRLASKSPMMRDLALAFRRSNGVGTLVSIFLLVVFIFSQIIYYLEIGGATFDETTGRWVYTDPDIKDKPMDFLSLFHTIWFVVVTMTTCGYGDMNVYTVQGKIAASLAIVTGVIVMSLPSVVFGGSFQNVLLQRRIAQQRKTGRQDANRNANVGPVWFEYPEGTGLRRGVYPSPQHSNECQYDVLLDIPRSVDDGVMVQSLYPSGHILYVPVGLASQKASDMAVAAMNLSSSFRCEVMVARPRPVRNITVSIQPYEGVTCVCAVYQRPTGNLLPVVLHCTDGLAIDHVLQQVEYRFEVDYDDYEGTGYFF